MAKDSNGITVLIAGLQKFKLCKQIGYIGVNKPAYFDIWHIKNCVIVILQDTAVAHRLFDLGYIRTGPIRSSSCGQRATLLHTAHCLT